MNRIITIALAVLGLTMGSWVIAATADGALGETSTGTVDVTMTVPDLVKISGLTTINLGTYTGTGGKSGNTDACIYRNGAETYAVKATTDKGAFRLSSGNGGTASEDITFTAYWNDESGAGAGRAELTYNTGKTGQTGANTTAHDCGGAKNANFSIEIAEAAINTKAPATYQATVTILITPE